jgi:hypothetical protein
VPPIVQPYNLRDPPATEFDGLPMIVLCGNAACGAVLRVASSDTPVNAVLLEDASGQFFVCPRCFRRTDMATAAAIRRPEDDSTPRPPAIA